MNNEAQRPSGLDSKLQISLCPSCGSNRLQTRLVTQNFTYGEGERAVEIEAVAPLCACESCGYEFFPPEAEDAQHAALCAHLDVMPPQHIVQIRSKHGFSRQQFAELSRIGEASLGRWERGTLIQNQANDRYLYLLQYEDNIVRLLNRSARRDRVNAGLAPSARFSSLEDPEKVAEDAANFNLRPRGRRTSRCM